MTSRHIITSALALLLLTACGESHKAKSLVEDFLSDNLADNAMGNVTFTRLDSTRYVRSQAVEAMRDATERSHTMKPGTRYTDIPSGSSKLLYIGVSFSDSHGLQVKRTVYLTPDLSGVVAIKEN